VVFTENPINNIVMANVFDDRPEELSRDSGTLQLKHGNPREPMGGSDSNETGNFIPGHPRKAHIEPLVYGQFVKAVNGVEELTFYVPF
jgi:hypothetical protein